MEKLFLLKPYYLWIKAFHIVFIVSWMAGLFYLPRLFVYHSMVSMGSGEDVLLQMMERRLYFVIMVPAMYLSLVSGGVLAIIPGIVNFTSGAFYLKQSCVVGLVVFQFTLNRWRESFLEGKVPRSTKFFRIVNEIPTVLLIIIVICIVVKPLYIVNFFYNQTT